MGNLVIEEVNFNGATLMAVQTDDQKIHVGVKWICQGLGLTENQQRVERARVQEDIVLAKGGSKKSLPTKGGKQDILCIELRFLPLWLAKINANIIDNPEVQEKLVDYQLNAADVLAKAFLNDNGKGAYTIPNLTPSTRPHYRARMISTAVRDADATAKTLQKMFGVREGVAQATAFKMVESAYGLDMTPVKQVIPAAKHDVGYLTPTEIGMRMGGKKASYINARLEGLGLQACEKGVKGKKVWRLTEVGRDYAEAFPYDAKTGHSGYQIRWSENVIALLEEGAAQ